MSPDGRMELRALALWHSRRRAVDQVLGPLLEYGPVAVDRVADRLPQLRELLADELAAFDAFSASLAESRQVAVVLPMFGRGTEPRP